VRRILLALALVLLPCAAHASVAVVHTGSTTGNAGLSLTVTMSGAPANGNALGCETIGTVATAADYSVKDSNSVSLTNVASAQQVQAFEYTVSGSPTATYTAATTSNFVTDTGCLELSGVSTTQYAGQVTTNTNTMALTVALGTVVFCAAKDNTLSTRLSSLTATGGTATTLWSDTTLGGIGIYFTATSTSITCVGTPSNSGDSVRMVQEAFTGSSVVGCPPYAYPCPFQPAFVPRELALGA